MHPRDPQKNQEQPVTEHVTHEAMPVTSIYEDVLVAAGTRSAAQQRQYKLQNDIINLIFDRRLDHGDPLPTEQVLLEELGVGRNSIREALKVLEALGIVEIRHGFGTFVGGQALTAMTRGLSFRGRLALHHGGREALELVEVREALEAGILRSVIPLMTDEHLATIKAAYDDMERSVREGNWHAKYDQLFHAAIFAPLGNDLLSGLLDVFWQVYNNIAALLDQVAPLTHAQTDELLDAHRQLYLAIEARDIDLSATLMREHFRGSRERLTAWQKTHPAQEEEPRP